MATVVNKWRDGYDVYIGRGTAWGNPFRITKEQGRDEVVEKYRRHLWKQIQSGTVTREMLIELDGKRLGCFCKPARCHGDILVNAIEWAKKEA
jgi:hypothetical protein